MGKRILERSIWMGIRKMLCYRIYDNSYVYVCIYVIRFLNIVCNIRSLENWYYIVVVVIGLGCFGWVGFVVIKLFLLVC